MASKWAQPSTNGVKRLLDIPLKHLIGFLYGGCFVFLTFAVSYAMVESSDFSLTSLRHGLSASASLLMTLESPRQMLSSPPYWLKAFGWIVCLCGWLMIPVLAGALVSENLKLVERDQHYRGRFKLWGQQLGKRGEELDAFIEEMM